MRNVKTREGMEYWDKICSLKHYGFLHSPDGKRVVKTEGIGNWIDKFEAQEIVDRAQDEINQYRAERDALQQLLNQRDEQVESLKMRPQVEPVARHPDAIIEGVMTSVGITHAIYASTVSLKHGEQVKLYAEQPAPVAVVPDGYCIMPRQLTAENGAKALLLGEFKLLITKECPECCELEEPVEGCSICDGEGEYGQKHTIPWDQIKYIYSKAVSGLAMKTEPDKSR